MNKVVFIMGPGHCGSTLLDLILGSHSSGFSLAEFRLITEMLNRSSGPTPARCAICTNECDFWDKKVSMKDLTQLYSTGNVLKIARQKFVRLFRNPYDPLFRACNKHLLIDSSKTPSWFRRQISSLHTWNDIQPYLIYLQRDGRAVVNSYYRKYPHKGVDKLTQDWIKTTKEMAEFYAHFPFPDRRIVHYEELAQRPQESVRDICDFLAIPYEEDMLRFWMHDHHPIAGNGGTQSLIFKYRDSIGDQSSIQKQYYDKQFYQDVGLAIRYDERWKEEFGRDQLAVFENIAGDYNEKFIYEIQRAGHNVAATGTVE